MKNTGKKVMAPAKGTPPKKGAAMPMKGMPKKGGKGC